MKKEEILNDVIKTFGFTPEQMIESWVESKAVSKDFLSGLISDTKEAKAETLTFLPSKKFETPKLILPGMFCYADGLIFGEVIPNEQITSVVGSVVNNRALSLCLREESLPWSSKILFLDAGNNITSGKEQTQLILEAAAKQGKKVEAAQYCHEYCENDVKKGSAFLAIKEELKQFYFNCIHINHGFSLVRAPELKGVYWSSSECDYYSAWNQRFSDGTLFSNLYHKYYSFSVRPVLEHHI